VACRNTLEDVVLRLIVVLALFLSLNAPASAQGGYVIGVEAGMYDVVVAGVQGWNAAGVGFTVVASGCGTGDITFCYHSDPWSVGGNADWIAWYPVGSNVIYVSSVSNFAFGASTVCHELGHWLGLHYHRSDYASCMTSPNSSARPAWPDDTDLANLGLSWLPQGAMVEEPTVTGLPKTGTGSSLP
jgi:hypothetical protein